MANKEDTKVKHVVVMEQDYDYANVIGVFHTLEEVFNHCRKNKLDINDYDVMLYTSSTECNYYENKHCKICFKKIIPAGNSHLNVYWGGWHCPLHYINAKKESDMRRAKAKAETEERVREGKRLKKEEDDFRRDNNIPLREVISRTPDGTLVRGMYLGEGLAPQRSNRPLLEHFVSGSSTIDGVKETKEIWKYED